MVLVVLRGVEAQSHLSENKGSVILLGELALLDGLQRDGPAAENT